MNKTNFLKAMKILSENFGLQINEGYSELMCKSLNLTDEQISKALKVFSLKETMPKMPSMAQWKKAAGIDITSPVNIACNKFLDKTRAYLTSNFILNDEKNEFLEGLSELERRILNSFGGISVLWADCHRDDYSRNISTLLNQLKVEFMNSATEYNITLPNSNKMAITDNHTKVFQDKVQGLISGSVKKLS